MSLTRRELAVTIGLGLSMPSAFSPVALAVSEENTLAVTLEWLPIGTHSPFYLAADRGWYKRASLDVTISQGSGSNISVQQVNAGQFDVGYASLSAMAFGRGKGMPLVSTCGLFRKSDMALIVPVNSPIKSPSDLKGKKIIATAGSFEAPFIDAFLAKGGLTRDQVELLNISTSTRMPMYIKGEVDGLFASPIGSLVLVEDSQPSRPILFADFGLNVPSFGMFATEAKLQKKDSAIRAFNSIIAGSWTYIVAGHQEEAIQAMLKIRSQDRLDVKVLSKQLSDSNPFLYSATTQNMPIGFQTEADWANALKSMEEGHAIAPGQKAKDYFTNDFLDADLIKSIGQGWLQP
jgi:NitT/TauT family transport system substrate-binding protein